MRFISLVIQAIIYILGIFKYFSEQNQFSFIWMNDDEMYYISDFFFNKIMSDSKENRERERVKR
jgi:hypothetical protein